MVIQIMSYFLISIQNCAKFRELDIVFNVYLENSFQSTVRAKRYKGTQRKEESNSQSLKYCRMFLSINDNKTELFCYL